MIDAPRTTTVKLKRGSLNGSEPVIEYQAHFDTHRVNPRGRMYWRGERVYFSDAFAHEHVGFEPIDYTTWRVHYGSFVIGRWSANKRLF